MLEVTANQFCAAKLYKNFHICKFIERNAHKKRLSDEKLRKRALDYQKTCNKNNQNNKYTLFGRKNMLLTKALAVPLTCTKKKAAHLSDKTLKIGYVYAVSKGCFII